VGYRYIGAKTRILGEVLAEIQRQVPAGGTVADIMCGTGAVSLGLRKRGYRVVAVDVMKQACIITEVKVLLQNAPSFAGARKYLTASGQTLLTEQSGYASIVQTLNNLLPLDGYFWREFSPEGKPQNGSEPRKYFSSENASKIDAARAFIQRLRAENAVTEIEHSLLIHDLIIAANDAANIAGTYGHYLSRFVPRALQPIRFAPMRFESGGLASGHQVINGFAENVAPGLEADLCYLDPPYMKRQYAANYHLLETIAREDEPPAIGKSGLRPWRDEYSDFCSKRKIRPAFEKVVTGMKCARFLVSYSSEGLLSKSEMLELLRRFGDVTVREFSNKRFKSRDEDAAENVTEFLFSLRREKGHA
jgi:adenine-specific DNA-methyltransferase